MERYIISKNCNTSYLECGDITPLERRMLMELISAEIKKREEEIQQIKNKKKKR